MLVKLSLMQIGGDDEVREGENILEMTPWTEEVSDPA